jgi:hypothetical protein
VAPPAFDDPSSCGRPLPGSSMAVVRHRRRSGGSTASPVRSSSASRSATERVGTEPRRLPARPSESPYRRATPESCVRSPREPGEQRAVRSRSSRSTAGMLRNLSVARRERSRLAPLSSGGGTAPFAGSPADVPETAVSPRVTARGCRRSWACCLVGQSPARNRALRCLVGLPSSNEGRSADAGSVAGDRCEL